MELSERSGSFTVNAAVNQIGYDLLVVLWGGTRPHIGAVGMAEPQQESQPSDSDSTNSSVFTFGGHKEDGIAREMSEALARALKRKVVVAAGMHWDDLGEEDITVIVGVCRRLGERIEQKAREL